MMSQEDYPVEFVLDSIEAVMAPSIRPKVLLFDMGGVCVCSPFQAILDYELESNIPPGWINHSISHSKPNGYWQRLERGEHPLNAAWFAGWSKDLHQPSLWNAYFSKHHPGEPVPELPRIDVATLFWSMISYSRNPDPWMYPALQRLHESGEFMLVALSNTLPLPEETPSSFHSSSSDLRSLFDIFIASDAIGLRKPSPEIYTHTVKAVNEFAKSNAHSKRGKGLGWEQEIRPEEILFLDDIGENLKGGKLAGFQTIKVVLGKTYEAVDQLQAATGLKLAGSHPRVPVLPGESSKGQGKRSAKL